METLVGFGGLVIAALIVLLWDYGSDAHGHRTNPEAGAGMSPFAAMTHAGSDESGLTLTYKFTRFDLVGSWLSFFFGHRTFHIVLVVGLVLLELLILRG